MLSFSGMRKKTPSEFVEEAIDIDVTPVMNMFIILIPFLVSMAVFTQQAIVDFNLPSSAANTIDKNIGEAKLKLTVVAAENYFALTIGEKIIDSVAVKNKKYDFIKLEAILSSQKNDTTISDDIVIAVKDKVKFSEVVKIMDICKITGFNRVGLSTAEIF